jgi:hypothetical protein
VSCLSRDYANLFHHEGSRTDKHVREHEVYSVVGGTPTARRVPETESKFSALANGSGWLAGQGPLGLRRTSLAAASALFGLLVGVGITARAVMGPAEEVPAKPVAAPKAKAVASAPAQAPKPTVEVPAPKPAAEAPKAKPAVEAAAAKAPVEKKTPKPVVVAAAPAAAPKPAPKPAATARLELAVNPWGEVFVDGQSRGVSPPLRTLEIPPGSHTIEIRNSTFKSHVEKVVIKPGEAVKIRHRFK